MAWWGTEIVLDPAVLELTRTTASRRNETSLPVIHDLDQVLA